MSQVLCGGSNNEGTGDRRCFFVSVLGSIRYEREIRRDGERRQRVFLRVEDYYPHDRISSLPFRTFQVAVPSSVGRPHHSGRTCVPGTR